MSKSKPRLEGQKKAKRSIKGHKEPFGKKPEIFDNTSDEEL
jgi:hypothetical protein